MTGLYANVDVSHYGMAHPTDLFNIDFFRRCPVPFYQHVRGMFPGRHLPTTTHYFIRLLQDKGLLSRMYVMV